MCSDFLMVESFQKNRVVTQWAAVKMRFSRRFHGGERNNRLCAHFASLIRVFGWFARVYQPLRSAQSGKRRSVWKCMNKALPTNWFRPHWMRLLLPGDAFCALTPFGTKRMWLALLAGDTSTTSPSRRAVLYVALRVAVFSHHLSFRGGVF